MSPPEFSIICHSHGGPATIVKWELPNNEVVWVDPDSMKNYTNYEASTVVIDTSQNCIYENRLRVRGKYTGKYTYNVNIQHYPHQGMDPVVGMINVLGMIII